MARSVISDEFVLRFSAAIVEAQDFETPDMPFTYTPLQGKEIRSLALMVQGWTADEGEDDINCILINLDPDLIPSYECLSYVWGPTATSHLRVWCNRRSFLVSNEMLSALKCLRAGCKGPRFLWIDQFCINQKDAIAKGKQVQRMAEIYQGAERVLLYPGLHPSFPLAAKFIFDFIGRFFWDYIDKSERVFRQHWLHYSADDLSDEYDIPFPDDEEWTAVRCLLSSPVFRRTWIMQELILAREVWIMIDEQEYQFGIDCGPGLTGFLTRKLITKTQSLDTLMCKETLRQIDGLPTWAPDWNCSKLERFGGYHIGRDEKLYIATKGLKLSIRNLKDGCKLGIQGIYLDTITSITTGIVDDELTGVREDLFGYGLWWLRAYSFIGPRYRHTNETLAQALGRTRLGDVYREIDKIAMKHHGLMDAKFYEVREEELPEDGPKTEDLGDSIQLVTVVANMSGYRVLFTTVDKYMGLAPLTARIGDMIFLLPGVGVPFVLRHPRDEEY